MILNTPKEFIKLHIFVVKCFIYEIECTVKGCYLKSVYFKEDDTTAPNTIITVICGF